MNEIDQDVTDYIAGLISGTDDVHVQVEPLHSMSLRLPIDLTAYLFVMAEHGDKSRNEMARLLLQAGIDSVISRLPPEVAHDIRESACERYQDLKG
jgi:hypothetical protein